MVVLAPGAAVNGRPPAYNFLIIMGLPVLWDYLFKGSNYGYLVNKLVQIEIEIGFQWVW